MNAALSGGVFYSQLTSLVFTNVNFLGNYGSLGGSFYTFDYSPINFTSCSIIDRTASSKGGVAYLNQNNKTASLFSINLTDSVVTNAYATTSASSLSNLNLVDITIKNSSS